MLGAQPAADELRIVQSAPPKPFPPIGDAVVGCHDPAHTVHWIKIITGKLWAREFQGRTLYPSRQDIALGVREFFQVYFRGGDCVGYENGDQVIIEAQSRWHGIDMMCARPPTQAAIGSQRSTFKAAATSTAPTGVRSPRLRLLQAI